MKEQSFSYYFRTWKLRILLRMVRNLRDMDRKTETRLLAMILAWHCRYDTRAKRMIDPGREANFAQLEAIIA